MVSVKAAWPASNEIAAGATPANSTATGSSSQSAVMFVPTSHTSVPPIRSPAAVPPIARRTFWPVMSALERRTDSVPRTTQKEC